MDTYLLVEKKVSGNAGEPVLEYAAITRVIRSYESASRADDDLQLLSNCVPDSPYRFFEVINVPHID